MQMPRNERRSANAGRRSYAPGVQIMGGSVAAAIPSDIISELCHADKDYPFLVWQNGTLSPCFNQLICGCLAHAFTAVLSACYLSVPRFSNTPLSLAVGWNLRAASALLLVLLFITDLVLALELQQQAIYLDILTNGCGIIAWLVHFMAVLALQRSGYRRTRGPLLFVALAVLPVPNLAFTIAAYIQDGEHLSTEHPWQVVRLALTVARAALILVYLLAFIFPCYKLRRESLLINADDAAPLITPDPCGGEMVAEDGCSCLSRLLYLWLNLQLKQGQRGELERPSDVFQLPRKLQTKAITQRFGQCWAQCLHQKALRASQHLHGNARRDQQESLCGEGQPEELSEERNHQEVKLLWVLHKAFGPRYYFLGVLKLLASLLAFAGPLLLSALVDFMETEGAPLSRGVWCAVGLFLSTFLAAFLRNVFVFEVSKVALEARAAVVSTIYAKALQVSGSALARFNMGEVVNFMSTDTDRLVNFFRSFHEVWSLPFQFALALYLLYLQVGVAFLGGLGVAILLVPLNKFLAARILENNKHMLAHKDSRVKLMTEVLFGIRVIKFYNWEQHFTQKINESRKKELSHLKSLKYLDAVCVYTWAALPVVISILTFVTYVLLGNSLTAAKVFTTLALVGMLILPLNSFPWVLNGTLEAKVSLDRIQQFLLLHNQDFTAYYSQASPEDPLTVVQMTQANFSWKRTDDPQSDTQVEDRSSSGSLYLNNLNLSIRKGSLVVVVGKVGCGKSSLLAAITGELNRCGGVVHVQGREQGFGLAAQEPWIQHATVRDNILFGKDFDSGFYQAVLEACALTDDLNILPDGDRTEVGENGVTLSGGQKSRLALARAVYMDKDLYLLDDPLAAVDADVAQHLMEKCILGILKNKTRILCTHRIEFVEKADMVVLMDNGTVVRTGTPNEVLSLMKAVPNDSKKDSKVKEKDGANQGELTSEPVSEEGLTTMGEEQKQTGGLAWTVYQSYWRAVGGCTAMSVFISLFLMQGSKNVSDWWLSYWISSLKANGSELVSLTAGSLSSTVLLFSESPMFPVPLRHSGPFGNMSSELKFYMTVYGSLAAANTVFTAARAFLFAYGAICAATVIHKRLLDSVLKATMIFFDTTPLGRVLNRFSSDVYTIDDSLPFVLNILLANVFGLLGMLVVMSYGLPWVLLPLVPLGVLYYQTQRFYRHSSRELKRLCSLTLSPVYSHFSETLSGLATVRASGHAARFEEENERRLDQNQRCLFISNAAMQWLDIRLQMIGVSVVTGISIIAVIEHQIRSIDPGLVGLALSYALSITNLLSGLIFSFTQTEMQLVSVERTEEYSTSIPLEPQNGSTAVPASWPEHGRVEFDKAVLAYRPGLPNALDGVSFVVMPGERVGIVGRTGSGKSTLFLTLFRMVELNQGQILVDGEDISQVGLSQLRSKLAIIPQDPFLFSSSVRENLDPSGRHLDHRLLNALEQCHLGDVVRRMGGLDAEVGERGKSLSVGQRQLVCLARALLSEANVLCIDEATASVDHITDMLLQKTIRERFKDKTVLTIAHRLNTIMDSDRVLVMHAGKPGHRRSLSEDLVLEDGDKGRVLVSKINSDLTASQGLQEGDEIVGATIHFDHLKKNEVIEILKLIEPYNDKVQVLTKPGLKSSRSFENLDNRIKAPNEVHVDSYNKIINAKVKKFMKGNPNGRSEDNVASPPDGQVTAQGLSNDKARGDSNLPLHDMPTVDVSLKKVNVEACLQKLKVKAPELNTGVITEYEYNSNLLLQGAGLNGTSEGPNLDVKSAEIDMSGHAGKLKMPKLKMPKFNSSGFQEPDKGDLLSPNLGTGISAADFDTGSANGELKLTKSGDLHKPTLNSPSVKGDIDGLGMDLTLPKLNFKGSNLNMKSPDIDAPSGKLKLPSSKIPDLGLSASLPHGPDIKGHGNKGGIDLPDMNLDFPEKETKLHGKSLDTDVDGPADKFKMPKMKTSKFSIPGFKGPVMDIEADLDNPDLSLSSPKLNADISAPDVGINGPEANFKGLKTGITVPDLDMRSGKMNMPKFKMNDFGHSGPKVKASEIGLSSPKLKGEINSPNLSLPQFNVDGPTGKVPTLETPEGDINTPDFNADVPSGKLKMPKFELSNSLPKGPNFKAPKIKGGIDAPDMNLDFPETDIKCPKLNMKSPDIDGPDGKFKMPKMKTPKFSIPGKGPDMSVKGNLDMPDLSLSSPKFDADIGAPNIDINGPKASLKGPETDFTVPHMDFPSGKVSKPKFKMPDFGLSGPKVKAPEMDLSLPKMKGEINSPNLSLPQFNVDGPTGKVPTLETPKVDINTPDFNTDVPSGKLKMPKFGLSTNLPKSPKLKGPKVKGGIEAPDINLDFPEADLKGPKLSMKSPDIDGPNGKFKMPKMKTPKFNFPKLKRSDLDAKGGFDRPDLSLSSPKFDADIGAPNIDINGPKASLKGPKTDFTVPDMDFPSVRVSKPKFKMPDFGLSGSKVNAPEMDLSLPKMKGEINSPNLSLPQFNVDGPTGKVPTFETPDVDINTPDFNADVPSGKLKMPKFGLSTNLPKSPKLKGPKVKGGIEAPDINLDFPEADLKGPKLNMKSPDIDGPDGKFKMPKMKTPKFNIPGLKRPDMSVKGNLDTPDLSLSSPKLDADIGAPNIDINGPKASLKGPETDFTVPDMDFPSGKVSKPKFKIPDFGLSGPKVKAPEMDLSLSKMKGEINSPNLSLPQFNVDGPTGKVPTFETPDVDINTPDFNADVPSGKLKMPKFGLSTNLPKSPKLKGPKVKGGIEAPDINLDFPEADLKGPKLNMKSPDIDGPDGKFKMPKMKTPKFNIPGFKGPDMSVKGKLDTPDLSLSSPKFDADTGAPNIDINGPKASLKGPKTDFTVPDMDFPSGKLSKPKFKMPDFGLSGPKVNTPEMDLSLPEMKGEINSPNLSLPQFNVDGPTGKVPTFETPEVDINTPDFNADVPSGKLKMPKFGLPTNLTKGPNLKGPKVKGGIKAPDINLDFPEADIKGPKLNMKSPDIDGPDGKFKMPKMKTPKFNIPGFKRPDMSVKGNLDTPDLSWSSPKFDADIGAPDIDINEPKSSLKGPKTDFTVPDINFPSGKVNVPKLKIPDLGLSDPKIKAPEIDLSGPSVKGEIDSPDFGVNGHKPKFTAPGFNVDVPTDKLKTKNPKISLEAPDMNTDAPSGKLKMPKFGLSDILPKGSDIKGPNAQGGIDAQDIELTLPEAALKSPTLNQNSLDIYTDGPVDANRSVAAEPL
ncbi:hypothetical protein MHYP_G00227380 [Metynnis hypsauchen]